MRKPALALIALVAAVPLAAVAKDNPDESFFQRAAQAGHAEVAAGKVAEEKATNPAVRQFAAMMVKDHAAANDRLGVIAGAKGIALPASPSTEQRAMNEKTRKISTDSFDTEYARSQIKAHEDTVSLLQKEIDSGKDADAKAFAAEMLPTVKAHLEKIRQIAADASPK